MFIVAMTSSSPVSAGFMGFLYINLINVLHENPIKYNFIFKIFEELREQKSSNSLDFALVASVFVAVYNDIFSNIIVKFFTKEEKCNILYFFFLQ